MSTAAVKRSILTSYLKAEGWSPLGSPGPVGELWQHKGAGFKVPVPHALEQGGAAWRLIVNRVAAQGRTTPAEVELRLRYWTTDVANLMAANDILVSDSIPLRAGRAMVTSSWQMLRSSATTARGPLAHIRGRYRKLGDEFLDAARMGHTIRGSYVIPILMPLSDLEPASDSAFLPGTVSAVIEPPERRIMRTFAESLTWMDRAVIQPESEPTGDGVMALVTAGVSKEFASALHAVLREPAVAAFSTDFQWAQSVTPPGSIPDRVEIPAAAADRVERVAQKLATLPNPSQAEVLIGPIIEVRYPPGDPFGSMVIQVIRHGRTARIRVTIREERIDEALVWMRSRETVVVHGTVSHGPGNDLRVVAPRGAMRLTDTMLDKDT